MALKTWRKRKFEKKLRPFQSPSAWYPSEGAGGPGFYEEREVGWGESSATKAVG